MNHFRPLFFVLLSMAVLAGGTAAKEPANPSRQQLELLVHEVTEAQNRSTTTGATVEDVDRLFAMFTSDFIYEHPMMGDTYTREKLYDNHVSAVRGGEFENYAPDVHGYRIVAAMYGDDAVAVQRVQAGLDDAPVRLAVFEIRDGKVARIREYWSY